MPARRLEMTISREEFLRLLPAAVDLPQVPESPEGFGHARGGRWWTLSLERLPDRRLGTVDLPRHRVELRFEGYSEGEVRAFMARFDQHFQRGGG